MYKHSNAAPCNEASLKLRLMQSIQTPPDTPTRFPEILAGQPLESGIVNASDKNFSTSAFRASLAMFATGVTIITARSASGEAVGLTVNSFNSVSLSPPLVLWSLASSASSMPVFMREEVHYAIHVLAVDQKLLAERFASRREGRWKDIAFENGLGNVPLLPGAAATFECRSKSRHTEGDHVIFVGEVLRCSHREKAAPLLFHGGRFYTEHPL